MMKKFRFLSLILALCLVFTAAAPAASAIADVPRVTAASVVIADMNSDRVLYEKNADEERSPASLTKIMTMLVAVEKIEAGQFALTDMVEALDDCRTGMDGDSSTADIYPGEIMSLQDLMYCAMLASANEACNIIARFMAGSISAYVEWMNAKALELGCRHTHFVNTNGLTESGHFTSAEDMAIITRAAVKHQIFMNLCNTITYETNATNTSEPRTLHCTNALICSDSMYGDQYLFKGAAGVKTGHTNAAGFCLVSTANRDGVSLICIVLGSEGSFDSMQFKNFEDTIMLYKWAFENYAYKLVLSMADGVKRVSVDLSKDDAAVILHPATDVRLLLPKDYNESQLVIESTVYDDKLTAPIEAGTVLGFADVYIAGEKMATVDLINTSAVELARGELLKRQIKGVTSSIWFKLGVALFVIIIVCYLLLVVRYRKMRRRQQREKQLAELRRRQARQRAAEQPRRTEAQEPTRAFRPEDIPDNGRSTNYYGDL